MLPPRLIFLFLSLVCGFDKIACVPSTELAGRKSVPASCALIVTDDDIPSGSATVGAMYVDNASFGRSLLTADVIATVEAFRAAGVQCVDVVDSHDGAIDPAPLKSLGVRLLTPSGTEPWIWPFLGPMDRDYSFAALIGFHSDAGQKGFRPHTINDWIAGLRVDGVEAGEVTHMFLGLRAFGAQVVLVSGDMNATAQARRLSPEVGAVTVRWLDSEGVPRFLDSAAASMRIRVEVSRAVQETAAKPAADKPIAIEISAVNRRLMAKRAAGIDKVWTQTLKAKGFDPKRFPVPAFSIRG
jgi:D-aminopeptidase